MISKKRRIFMVNQGDDSQKFGVGKYISEMIDAAKKQGRKCQMVVITIGAQTTYKVQIMEQDNITYFNIPKPFLQKQELIYGLTKQSSHAIFLILMDFFSISETDIFHFNSNIQHFLLLKIKTFTPAKIVYTVHVSMWNVLYKNNEENFLSEWNDSNCFSMPKKNILAEIESCKQADRVVGLSNNTFDDLKKYYNVPKNKLRRIFNGISTTPPSINNKKMKSVLKNVEIEPKDVVFLFAGRLNEQKGISDLVETFEILHRSGYTNLKLIVLGDGSLKHELASKNEGLKHSIFFLGYVPQSEIHYYYKLADVIVIPSLYDQNPYTILEAMAYKVSMIVTDIDAFDALERDSVCLKAPLESETKVDISALKKNMQRLIENPELRDVLAENAHHMLLQNFSSDKMFIDTYNIEACK